MFLSSKAPLEPGLTIELPICPQKTAFAAIGGKIWKKWGKIVFLSKN